MKKKFLIILGVLIAAYYLMTHLGEEKPKPPPPRPAAQKKASTPPLPKPEKENIASSKEELKLPPSQSTTPRVWPFIREDTADVALADHLTVKNYLLIFDGSGSMKESKCSGDKQKIQVAKEAVAEWSKTVPKDANLGLYVFHNNRHASLPLSSGPRDRFVETIRKIQPGGKTPLSDAMAYAYTAFTQQAQRQLGYGEYTIVVITDGIANNENRLRKTVEDILESTPIIIYSIGFCIDERHSLNQLGRTLYRSANNPTELRQGLQEVLAESETFDETEFR